MKRLKDAIKAQTDYTIAVSILMLNIRLCQKNAPNDMYYNRQRQPLNESLTMSIEY